MFVYACLRLQIVVALVFTWRMGYGDSEAAVLVDSFVGELPYHCPSSHNAAWVARIAVTMAATSENPMLASSASTKLCLPSILHPITVYSQHKRAPK